MYIPWPFPPVWGLADNTKETTKTMGISLRSSSNDMGPSRVWMALLEQHSPSSPISHNLRRFIDATNVTNENLDGKLFKNALLNEISKFSIRVLEYHSPFKS